MKFIGRKEELNYIKKTITKDHFQAIIIYGRRRLGKTELAKESLKDFQNPVIFFQCRETNEMDNVISLTDKISSTLDNPFLHFSSLYETLKFVFEYSINNKVCLVIDEYPYLREIIDGCDSIIQSLIDEYLNKANLKLFLLGSSISVMEDVLSHNSPLYGRFTQTILLKEMDYYDSSLFYPSFSPEDKVALYSVFGGVPFYNAQINEKESVRENIIRLISGSFASLKEFIETYIKSELRKMNNANIVFEIIALGTFHFSDILSKSHIESSSALSQILTKLIKMDLIENVAPINDKTNKQKSGYRIKDNCLKFYYQFIFRNISSHNILDDDIFYENFIEEDFNKKYVPKCFEEISKQYLIRMNKNGLIKPLLLDIGTYWYDDSKNKVNGQFDIVSRTKDGYVFFECKYSKNKITNQIIEQEIEQIKNTGLNPIRYGFFSKSGFDVEDTNNYLLYKLEDLYLVEK